MCACRLVFNGGGKLLWWVGQCKPFHNDTQDSVEVGRTTKCGNPVPPTSSPAFETQGDGREIEKAMRSIEQADPDQRHDVRMVLHVLMVAEKNCLSARKLQRSNCG